MRWLVFQMCCFRMSTGREARGHLADRPRPVGSRIDATTVPSNPPHIDGSFSTIDGSDVMDSCNKCSARRAASGTVEAAHETAETEVSGAAGLRTDETNFRFSRLAPHRYGLPSNAPTDRDTAWGIQSLMLGVLTSTGQIALARCYESRSARIERSAVEVERAAAGGMHYPGPICSRFRVSNRSAKSMRSSRSAICPA